MVHPHPADEADAGVVPSHVDFAFEGAFEDVVDVVGEWDLPRLHAGDKTGDFEDGASAGAGGAADDIVYGDVFGALGAGTANSGERHS